MRPVQPTELMLNPLLHLQEVPEDQHRLEPHFYLEGPKSKKNVEKRERSKIDLHGSGRASPLMVSVTLDPGSPGIPSRPSGPGRP